MTLQPDRNLHLDVSVIFCPASPGSGIQKPKQQGAHEVVMDPGSHASMPGFSGKPLALREGPLGTPSAGSSSYHRWIFQDANHHMLEDDETTGTLPFLIGPP
ncbi:hypothetical protein VTJ04DRAFT_8950 [Mycothermus thermophilus]|uniref:uncharacterized protein n=1 Tax=Humicola insolens TaxID=85995 RepID=UPI003743E99A